MKKSLLSLCALAAMAAMQTSCSEEQVIAPVADGNVSIAVKVPGAVMSRAFGDGTTAQENVHYYVYDQADVTSTVADGIVPMTDLKGTVTLTLATAHSYDVVFVATATDAPYTYSVADRTITIDYSNAVTSAENLDAFYDVVTFTVAGSQSYTAELTRPFAQLNVGTADLTEYQTITGTTVATTEVTISQVYTTIDLMTGTLSDVAENVTFAAAALPQGETFPATSTDADGKTVTYTYLSMDYLLVAAAKDMVDVNVKVGNANGTSESLEFNNIPVQANYRTNIYGDLLTAKQIFNVEILPEFETPDFNEPQMAWDGKTITTPAIDEATKTITIASGDELAGLAQYAAANDLENYTVNLSNSIDLGGNEMPTIGSATRADGAIGAGSQAFKGVFDGGGNVIKNFTITNNGDKATATALIPAVSGANAVVRNLTLENVAIISTNSEQTAAVVGLLADGATVENVKVLSGSVKGGKATAGVVSRILSNGTVKNCSNAADVVATGANCGGVVGAAYYNNENGTSMNIENCSNSGKVSGTTVVGGVVGLCVSNVTGCSNSGEVTGNGACIGGVIGEQQNIGNVTGCVNTGAVTNNANAYATGGVIGWVRYSGVATIYTSKAPIVITDCKNSAVITSKGDAGGIVGTIYNYGTVTGCTNTAASINAGTFAAGLVANQQVDKNIKIGDLEWMVTVKDNITTTPLDEISGTYKNLFMYVNTPDAATVEDNKTTL